MSIPRSEHPNPQFMRTSWQNLNGCWEFEIDSGRSGVDRRFFERDSFSQRIIVPFCPESMLSGVGCKDFMSAVWYRRSFYLDKSRLSDRVLLHFGAVDYEAIVYINKKEAGRHRGGYTTFWFDITGLAKEGVNILTVCAIDDVRAGHQPRGKQSELYYSHGCDYTRTTGIWQTVWLEFVPKEYIKNFKFYPDVDNSKVSLTAELCGKGRLSVDVSYDGRSVGSAEAISSGGHVSLEIPLKESRLWEPGNGRLYDVKLRFGKDEVSSYFGLRSVRIDGKRFMINGKSVFQRLVLDQGFYPDGIYTAPDEDALIKDIRLSMELGFNGARLHQKVFEPRFLYHCDRMGYIVWGEYASWGFDHSSPENLSGYLNEWQEAVERDFNHPAIVGWCPFNETWDYNGRRQDDRIIETVYRQTKLYDPTRPCIDTSGHYHVATDIFDVHDYEQNPEVFAGSFKALSAGKIYNFANDRQTYKGEPVFVSEYGGIQWSEKSGTEAWGYGSVPKTQEEFIERLRGLTNAIMDNENICGLCYTQLYDVEQEENGLYTYQREGKFDADTIRGIFSRRAKIETHIE